MRRPRSFRIVASMHRGGAEDEAGGVSTIVTTKGEILDFDRLVIHKSALPCHCTPQGACSPDAWAIFIASRSTGTLDEASCVGVRYVWGGGPFVACAPRSTSRTSCFRLRMVHAMNVQVRVEYSWS